IRPITIQDLHTEVNNLKKEIREVKRNQDNHQLILSQLMQREESDDGELDSLINQLEFSEKQENEISNDNDGKEILRIINIFSFMKCRVNIRIVVKDFVLETIALFDSGADSNCIKEGLIPTKYFEKTTKCLRSITDFPGITSFVGGHVTFFEFLDSPTQKSLNQIESKTKQICFLKEEIS
ncbi:hypothetical protein S245_013074, partial [Arachis hypogaea]